MSHSVPLLIIILTTLSVWVPSAQQQTLASNSAKTQNAVTRLFGTNRTASQDEGIDSSPCVADIDGDGKEEIVCGYGNYLRCLNLDNTERWTVDTGSRVASSPACCDVNGDGQMEIFVGNRAGYVWGFASNGRVLTEWGWPKATFGPYPPADGGVHSTPAIGDIDGDGKMEIVVGCWSMLLWAWHYEGPVVSGFPVAVRDTIWSSPAIGDVNRDGLNEIVIGADCTAGPGWPYPSGGLVFVVNGWGQNLPNWPKSLPQVMWSSPALADLNGDGYLDIIMGSGLYYQGVDGAHVYAWDFMGNNLPGWPVNTSNYVFSSPAVGDVNNDGRLEVVANDISGNMFVFSSQGQILDQRRCITQLASPSLGDIDGNGLVEYMYEPKNTAALGDFDRDGRVEIATENGVQRTGARYNPGKFPWPMFRHDAQRTGNMGNPPPPPPNYETYILLVNPNSGPANVTLTYMIEGEESQSKSYTVGPNSRKTVFLNDEVGFGKSVSTKVSSNLPVMAERSMYFNSGGRTDGHCSIGAAEPSGEWFLAEGYTGGQFDTWILVQNPNKQATHVTATLMKEDGSTTPVSFDMPPESRRTIHVDEVPGFDSCSFSTHLVSRSPVVAERAMYFDYNGLTGGSESVGVPAPDKEWYLPEGCSGWGFDTFVLTQNPGDAPARVDYTFMREDGKNFHHSVTLAPHSRYTIRAADMPGIQGCNFSTKLTSDQPVCCERAMYFDNGGRTGGHCSIGTTAPAGSWYFAEGYTAEQFDTWILLQNPNEKEADVRAVFMKPDGNTQTQDYKVAPNSRRTVHIDEVPGMEATEFSTRLQSTNDVSFIAERAMYFNYKGVWDGGHDTIGSKSPGNTWYFAEGYTGQ